MPCTANINSTNADRLGLKARYFRLLDSLSERAAQRAAYRRTVADLQALSDRDLADFGYHRSEIPRIARDATASV